MELLFHIRCHKILDNLQVEKLVVIVVCTVKDVAFVESLQQQESKIILFVVNGDSDTSKDNKRIRRISYSF